MLARLEKPLRLLRSQDSKSPRQQKRWGEMTVAIARNHEP
jgi:hypothetical protein